MKPTKNNNKKSITLNFPPRPIESRDNLPIQYRGNEIGDRGPVGFYRNVDKLYTGIVFRDVQGNITYLDIQMGIIKSFDQNIWCDSTFIYQPQLTCLHIKCDEKILTINKCK